MTDVSRRDAIRSRARALGDEAVALRSTVTDAFLLSRLDVADTWLRDVLALFVEDRVHVATDAEDRWLGLAENYMAMVDTILKGVRRIVDTYGPDAKVVS